MKKMQNITLLIIFLFTIGIFSGCERDLESEGISGITYFPTFESEGEFLIIHELGTPYIDQPVTATEAGNSLEVKVKVTSEITGYSATEPQIDVNTIDKYTITYSSTNSDGFDGGVTRTVVVSPANGDLVNNIEGIYLSTVKRTPAFETIPLYTNMTYIIIWKISGNTYGITDAVGGYYYLGRDYGYDYAASDVVITANNISMNDFSFSQGEIPGFGNTIDLSDMIVDPVNKTISFTSTGNFDNGVFKVQLKQVQF